MRSAERSCEGQTDTPQSSRPDAEKIKKDVCGDVEEEFRKKKRNCLARYNFELTFETKSFFVHIMKTWLSVYTWSSLILDYKKMNCFTLSSQNIFLFVVRPAWKHNSYYLFPQSVSFGSWWCNLRALCFATRKRRRHPHEYYWTFFRVPISARPTTVFLVSLALDLK